MGLEDSDNPVYPEVCVVPVVGRGSESHSGTMCDLTYQDVNMLE